MILKLFKPSWRKVLVTVCLYGMVGLSSDLDKVARKVAREELAATVLGQRFKEDIERIYKEVRCEANEQVAQARVQLMDEMREQDLADTLEFKASFISGLITTTLLVFCYLLACIACTGAVIRLREKPESI
ncbi:hypothetical protein [Pseudomonas leptonychotis]|uniref:DUF2937 family protein n=1 Tax=Pseudomonas leptonychotis TaxID=2448482 RepID=A0A4T2A087_9PSED|nr:hypothetical protein [Pseudomonas leptonychotis]TIH08501.1 hypothetical protein D8779_13440 [Pseudomonas leptonychotis]